MREVYYNSDITPNSISELKLLALYYDKIHIVNDAIYSPKYDKETNTVITEAFQFIPKSFSDDHKLLLDEKIISITKRDESKEDIYEKLFAKKISDLVNSKQDIIFPNHPTEKDGKIITEEVYHVMKHMYGFEFGQPVEVNFVWYYYAFKLKWFLKLLMEGQTCLSSSNNLNTLFSAFIQDTSKSNNLGNSGHAKSLAFDALKISLPNPDVLSFEEILELKANLKDELAEFYNTINAIEVKNKQLFNFDLKSNEYDGIFYTEIQKPLNELKSKMANLKSKTFRKFVDNLLNPLKYAPLTGTFFASLPIEYTMLTSLGLISGVSYMEYKEDKRLIENNGLYYLLKLK